VTYLGDARAEKGFALLPSIGERLSTNVIDGRRIRIAAQTYQTSAVVDVAILQAIDRLERCGRHDATLIDEPLPADGYAALLGISDLVYNLYRREDYIARSSGVFVEAVAWRKPVIVTAGTWMSAVLGEHAAAFHRYAIPNRAVLDEFGATEWDESWRRTNLRSDTDVTDGVPPAGAGEISTGFGSARDFVRPVGATHAWLELTVGSPFPDICIAAELTWSDSEERAVHQQRQLLNRLSHGPLSLIADVPADGERLSIEFAVAYAEVTIELKRLVVRWIEAGCVPSLPGGVAIDTSRPGRIADDAAAAIAAICANYDAYRQSADWLAGCWADGQTAERLLSAIAAAPALAAQTRFTGKDW
jgi:hypothetical protein